MSFRIGTTEVQGIYLGATEITEIYFDNINVVTPTASRLLQEDSGALLTESGGHILLEQT